MTKVWKHSLDYNHPEKKLKAVNMSKASLGKFMYWACKYNAKIGQVWPFNPRYERCWVGVTMEIEDFYVAEFMEQSGFGLVDPPKVNLNDGGG